MEILKKKRIKERIDGKNPPHLVFPLNQKTQLENDFHLYSWVINLTYIPSSNILDPLSKVSIFLPPPKLSSLHVFLHSTSPLLYFHQKKNEEVNFTPSLLATLPLNNWISLPLK